MSSLRGERGASAVEFAIVAVVLFMVLFGTIQFGVAYHRDQGLEAAAREGARLASIGKTAGEVVERVRRAQSLFQDADIEVRFRHSRSNGTTWTPALSSPALSLADSAIPCASTFAGFGNLVRVEAQVPPPAPPNADRYAITIPLWGNRTITYSAVGVFRCELVG